MTGRWVPPDRRDEIVDCVTSLSTRTALPVRPLLRRLDIARAKFARGTTPTTAPCRRRTRPCRLNIGSPKPNGPKFLSAIRRIRSTAIALMYRLVDAGDVAVSSTFVYLMLKVAGMLDRWARPPSKTGTGLEQPAQAHAHWPIDFSYVNIAGTFSYLGATLDRWSRFLERWELRESMTTANVTTVLTRANEQFSDVRPRIISGNTPQSIARDFREFIRISGLTHVRMAPYYPQPNGQLERWNQTLKVTRFGPTRRPRSKEAQGLVTAFIAAYNTQR